MDKPKQRGITAFQRRALRRYASQHPHLRQHALREWFTAEFQRNITQSTVSESLSAKFRHLDSEESTSNASQQQRERALRWPELDRALIKWVQESQSTLPLTGEAIKEKATRFWRLLDCYQGMEVPMFSNGWLNSFKKRHQIKSRARFGEEASINNTLIQQQITQVQAIARMYPPCDVYNCDETGIYWKMIPDRGLSTEKLPGVKKEKERITAHFCCNADGSDKLPVWFIGKAAKPRCFGSANINISNLNCIWRHNGKAWMVTEIMLEWLQWFGRHVSQRRVLLIMDNFSAHETAVKLAAEQGLIQHVTICWLPPNSTARTQPLDQGIIRTFKAYYRRKWVEYLLDEYDLQHNPLKTINILKVIRWSISAWNLVKVTTIQNCWTRSKLLEFHNEESNELGQETARLQAVMDQLQLSGRIQQAMSLDNLLNPEEEVVQDVVQEEELELQIAGLINPQPDYESEEEEEVIPPISVSAALSALQTLRVYEEQQEDCDNNFTAGLDRHEQLLQSRRQRSLRQQSITTWFT
jgi:hypothetical protein